MHNNRYLILLLVCIIIIFANHIWAETFIYEGGMNSEVDIEIYQEFQTKGEIRILELEFASFPSFSSPSVKQKITNYNLEFSEAPDKEKKEIDDYGNEVNIYRWKTIEGRTIWTRTTFTAELNVELTPLESTTKYPMSNLSSGLDMFLQATTQVQSDDATIKKLAKDLIAGCNSEYEAVSAILNYVIDNCSYILTPPRYDALYMLKTKKGNCQNYSHLSVALLRAAGIPARVVGGLRLKKAWKIPIAGGTITQNNGQGRHAWIEVYYPDLGWIPYDAQQSHLFVNSHYIRQMVGPDASSVSEAMRAAPKLPANSEDLNPDFKKDIVSFTYKDVLPFPDNYVISGVMAESDLLVAGSTYDHHSPIGENTTETPPVIEKPIETTPEVSSIEMPNFTKTVEFGLTDLPVIDIFGGESAISEGDELVSATRQFISYTDEYVTSDEIYAQAFTIDVPTKLDDISLAMLKFDSPGVIWIELYEDIEGFPDDKPALKSLVIDTKNIPFYFGYQWITFKFDDDYWITSGKYWIAIRYAGDAILNWHCIYGNPHGDPIDTRSRLDTREKWDNILNIDFNFRVRGMQ